MTNEESKVLSLIVGLFETEFAKNCPYFWPCSIDFAYHVFYHSSYNLSLEQLVKEWNQLSVDEVNENEQEDVLKESSAWEWNSDILFCSATFFILSFHLENDGRLYPNKWFSVINSVMFIDTGKQIKLLNLIKRNGFFELSPHFAIDAAKEFFIFKERIPGVFFDSININDSQQRLATILKLLQLEENEIDLLVNETFKIKSFSKIIHFLENCNLTSPNLLSLTDLEVLFTKLGLPERKRKVVLSTISQTLDNSNLN